MCLVEPSQLVLLRVGQPGGVLQEEVELLREAPPHDRVALVEPHLPCLAGKDFLLQQLRHEIAQLLGGRFPAPLARPRFHEPPHLALPDSHLARLRAASVQARGVEPGVKAEQQASRDDEMQ